MLSFISAPDFLIGSTSLSMASSDILKEGMTFLTIPPGFASFS